MITIRLWLDDCRPAPEGYIWCKTVNEAKDTIMMCELYATVIPELWQIELIDVDHDSGEYVAYGGDYIKLLDWLEETGRNYPIRIHSMNVVGVANMRRIIERNGWKEIR